MVEIIKKSNYPDRMSNCFPGEFFVISGSESMWVRLHLSDVIVAEKKNKSRCPALNLTNGRVEWFAKDRPIRKVNVKIEEV